MQQSGTQFILLGKVVGTHGLRGDLKIRSHPENQAALLSSPRFYLKQGEAEPVSLTPVNCSLSKGNLVVRFSGHGHVGSVESLVGADVYIDPAQLKRETGETFWFELEGLEVIDRERGLIGNLVEMFRTAAHGIYVVQGPFGEVLIPAIPQFVDGLDEADRLQVDVPDGLFPDGS